MTAARSPAAPDGLSRQLIATVASLSAARDLDTVMRLTTRAGRDLLGCDGVSFVLRDGGLCHYAEEDALEPLWKGRRFPQEECISGVALRERRLVVVDDVAADPRLPVGLYRPTFVRSLAVAPVREDDPVAVLGAYWGRRHQPTPAELELLQALSNAAALALANVELARAHHEAREAERHQRLLVAELSHRVKNTLAVVQSIARQTLVRAADLEQFGDRFLGRLGAMAEAHGLLVTADWKPVPLHAAAAQALAPWQAQCRLRGDAALTLPPPVHLALALVLYELACNAARHGALSVPGGGVDLDWRLTPNDDGRPGLALHWREHDGPPVAEPLRKGFGTRLITGMIGHDLSGRCTMVFDPAGLHCRLWLPADP